MGKDNILATIIGALQKKKPIIDGDTTMPDRSMVTTESSPIMEGATRVPTQVFRPTTSDSPANVLFQKIQDLQGKDYSKKKGVDGTVTYGKDYDPTHNFKDIARGIGLGALSSIANAQVDPRGGKNALAQLLGAGIGGAGGGGIAAGVDRNYDNKLQDQMKLKGLIPQYENAFGLEQQKKEADQKNRISDAQAINLEQTPEYKDREAKRKDLQLALKSQLDQDRLDYNIDTATKLNVWRNRKLDADIEGNETKAKLAQSKIDEIVRHDKQTETQADINEKGRNTRTNQIIGGANTRTQMTIDSRKALQESAQKYGREKTISDATTHFKTEYFKMNGKSPSKDEIDRFINSAVIPEIEATGEAEVSP